MNAPTPSIEQLRELALPAPVSYWPQTWGWLLLGVLLLVGLLAWALLAWRRWANDRYRREALARLDLLATRLDDDAARLQALRELPELLKRVALSMPGAPAVAALHDSHWQVFLAAHAGKPLPDDFARQLAQLAYAPDRQLRGLDARTLLRQGRDWVEHHHVAA